VGATIDSGISSNVVKVRFTSSAASNSLDSIRVKAVAGCIRSTSFSKLKLVRSSCSLPIPVAKVETSVASSESMSIKLFPNPSNGTFNLQVKGVSNNDQIHVRVLGMEGLEYNLLNMMPGETLNFGSEMKSGSYLIEVKQGSKTKITRAIKL
jgi:hypothetical protein